LFEDNGVSSSEAVSRSLSLADATNSKRHPRAWEKADLNVVRRCRRAIGFDRERKESGRPQFARAGLLFVQ